MKTKNLVKKTIIIIFSVLTVLLIWDVYIAIMGRFDATISKQTQLMSSKFPLLPFAWGLLEAHFFYGKLGRKLFGGIPTLRYFIWIPITIAMFIFCIINLFSSITFIQFLGDNLYIPALAGQFIGCAWYQKEIIK